MTRWGLALVVIAGMFAPPGADLYTTYQQTPLQAFVGTIDDLLLIGAALGALLLRSGGHV